MIDCWHCSLMCLHATLKHTISRVKTLQLDFVKNWFWKGEGLIYFVTVLKVLSPWCLAYCTWIGPYQQYRKVKKNNSKFDHLCLYPPEIQILDRPGHLTTHRKESLETLHLGAPKVEHFPICKNIHFSKSSCWSCNYLNAKSTIHSNKASCFTFGLRAILCLPICLLNSTSLNLNKD